MTEITDDRIQLPTAAAKPTVVPLFRATACWVETAQGKRVDLVNPDPAQIDIEDIAWSLSRLARFNGHTRYFDMLSVGSHSLWVSMYIWERTRSHLFSLYGLLHDAHEAFMGDIPTPLKALPGMRERLEPIEHRLQAAIYQALKLDAPCDNAQALIKEADAQALAMEARHHMQSRGQGWLLAPINDTACRVGEIRRCQPLQVFEGFMTAFSIYITKLDGLH